jgi:acyl-[acyl-carrier-protein]-phospholipid O-acyltransferase/long-chain-fatty-acid--[acyl-carrier-protein] ligase
MLKKTLHKILTFIYKIEVKGIENYKKAGDRILIVSNHTSFLDPLLLGVFLPDDITFAINTQVAESKWVKPFLGLSHVFPMDPTQPLSLKALIQHLQQDKKTVIFPEGRITVTGSLMKIYDGTGMVADKSGATILPVRVHGAQYTHFSKLKNIVRLRWFPKITIQILPHRKIEADKSLTGKLRRKHCGQVLSDIMSEMVFATNNYQQTFFSALLEARTVYGGKHIIAEDLERVPLSYNGLITQVIAIANALKSITKEGENIGVYLPNSTKTLSVVLGLQLHGRVPAMLNYSTGSTGMVSACKTAQIKTVLTSRRFIDLGKFQEDADALATQVNLVYLEDLATSISTIKKLTALVQSKIPSVWYDEKKFKPDSPAVVLFTSGSEGEPKGVVLSHSNILANHHQIASRITFNSQDVILNYLPMFHSFGFTAGTMLPIFQGMTTFFYPTPLHFSVIPEIAYDIGATIMFGTNTFLASYANKAHPYDFYKMRYVVAGAEKLQDSTRALWADKFGIRILEGYGATETAPVASVNTPMAHKTGTVGRLMPQMEYKLEDIPGISDGGKLHLSGPNIMQGYLLSDNPGKLTPPESIYGKGWYDTGDIAHVDEEGYVSIRGRSKRFAKVGGEMVSLTTVESHATKAWPDAQHASTCLPDPKKGEQVILLTTQKDANSKQLLASTKGVNAISLPKKVLVVDTIPILATGKTNYPAVLSLAEEKLK